MLGLLLVDPFACTAGAYTEVPATGTPQATIRTDCELILLQILPGHSRLLLLLLDIILITVILSQLVLGAWHEHRHDSRSFTCIVLSPLWCL